MSRFTALPLDRAASADAGRLAYDDATSKWNIGGRYSILYFGHMNQHIHDALDQMAASMRSVKGEVATEILDALFENLANAFAATRGLRRIAAESLPAPQRPQRIVAFASCADTPAA